MTALRRYGLHKHSSFIHLQGIGSWTMREIPCPSPIAAGSGIDIWHGAGPPAHSSKRFISLNPSGRTANRDRPPRAPDRRIGYHADSKETWRSLPVAAVAGENPDLSGTQNTGRRMAEAGLEVGFPISNATEPGSHRGQWRFSFNNTGQCQWICLTEIPVTN